MPRKKREPYDIEIRFGRRIRALRRHHGMSQQDLADAMFMSVVTASRLENGAQCPPITKLPYFARIFSLEVWELFYFRDDARMGKLNWRKGR